MTTSRKARVGPHFRGEMHSPRAGVTERLVAALAQAIAEGRLAPGQRLVEADLQADYGAGRSSVREAIGRLQAQGLLVITANRGAAVRRLSRKEVMDLFAIRERLEGLGAFLAASRAAAQEISALELQLLREMHSDMGRAADALAYGRLNREFHDALLALAGNEELVRLVRQLSLPIFQQQFRGFLKPDNQRASHGQHERIVAAVVAGDARAAEAAMREHVRDGLQMVLSWPEETFGH